MKCRSCLYENAEGTPACSLCGVPLWKSGLSAPAAPVSAAVLRPVAAEEPVVLGNVRVPRFLFYAGLGLLLTILGSFIEPARMFGWGAGAFAHEFGHALAGWFFGMPSIPLFIVTSVQDQKLVLALLVWAALGWGAWSQRGVRPRLILFGILTLVYPFLAFTRAREVLVLLFGHGGEIVFAAFCFWRALEGGLYDERERPIYAILAWTLWLRNAVMCRDLIRDASFREQYLTMSWSEEGNDYERVANLFHWRLESVAALMLGIAVVLPALAILLWWIDSRGRREYRVDPTTT